MRRGLRVIATGGRKYSDATTAFDWLDAFHQRHGIAIIIEGGYTGLDAIARKWASLRGIPAATFSAHWVKFGGAAGPIRNGWMLEFMAPDLVLAFPGGSGTADMVWQAREAGVRVLEAGIAMAERDPLPWP